MLLQTVQNYQTLCEPRDEPSIPHGDSAAAKEMIFHIYPDHSRELEVLDIGFGGGKLGQLIKNNSSTAHWHVDGVDGFAPSCHNKSLFEQKIYRNVWQGYAQELPYELLQSYDILCLLDVIEHLNIETAKYLLRNLLTSMNKNSLLFISTPLWFYPQGVSYDNHLEEHLIGVPASSMMALQPIVYVLSSSLVGNFVYSKKSLDFVDFFQPTTNKNFSMEQGVQILRAVGMNETPYVLNYMK